MMYIQLNKPMAVVRRVMPTRKQIVNNKSMKQVSNLLGLDTAQVVQKTEGINVRQFIFLENLSRKYNGRYHYAAQKEDPNTILDIVQSVRKPKKMHFSVVDRVSGSFKNMQRLLELINNKRDGEFVQYFETEIMRNKKHSENILPDILESPNKDKYVKSINEYKSYFRLNAQKADAVKTLDEMITNGTYNRERYDKERYLNNLTKNSFVNKIITKDNLDNYYTKEGVNLLETFVNTNFMPKKVTPKSMENILEIYKTCNKKNIDIRKFVLGRYINGSNQSLTFDALTESLRSVFERADESKYVQKFIKEFLSNSNNIENIQSLDEILRIVPPKKAFVFNKNIARIIKYTKQDEERESALTDKITKYLFENRNTRKEKHRIMRAKSYGLKVKNKEKSKVLKFLENEYNKLRYSIITIPDSFAKNGKPVKTQINPDTMVREVKIPNQSEVLADKRLPVTQGADFVTVKKEPIPNEKLPAVIVKPKYDFSSVFGVQKENAEIKSINIPQEKLPAAIFIPRLEFKLVNPQTGEKTGLKLVNTLKKSAKERKIELQKEVQDYIKQKLHAKTVEKQGADYAKNATKMRLKLLPEIFDSIKETRKADRAVGKLKFNSANKDALDLYTRINGQNRKLIRYMLMKRNVDGTRMFEVRNIIDFIDKANKRVIKEKALNKEYSTKDKKAYFEHLYQTRIEEYGKLQRPKKNKK